MSGRRALRVFVDDDGALAIARDWEVRHSEISGRWVDGASDGKEARIFQCRLRRGPAMCVLDHIVSTRIRDENVAARVHALAGRILEAGKRLQQLARRVRERVNVLADRIGDIEEIAMPHRCCSLRQYIGRCVLRRQAAASGKACSRDEEADERLLKNETNSVRDHMTYSATSTTITFEVVVKPGSREPGLTQQGGALVLRVRERAVDGAANRACIRALAGEYGVPPSAVELISGVKSRRKRFAVSLPPQTKGRQ
jgi:uncharacterized protein